MLKNYSNDLNHSSKFTVLVVVPFTKKEEEKDKDNKQSKHTTFY